MNSSLRKIVPYFLVILMMLGFAFLVGEKSAFAADPTGRCTIVSDLIAVNGTEVVTTEKICKNPDRTQLAALIHNDVRVIRDAKWNALSSAPGFCYVQGTRESGWISSFFKAISSGTSTVRQFGAEFPGVLESNCTYEGISKINNEVRPSDSYIFNQKSSRAGQEAVAAAEKDNAAMSDFEKAIDDYVCGLGISAGPIESPGSIYPGCVLQILYGIGYVLPAFLLTQVAYFFNVIIAVTINGALFTHPFVTDAWKVVRDLSNMFFILILLYVAIETILGLAHDAKKTIVSVIVMALLINFSMFFTGIVIDTSNILALVFYNKVEVQTTVNGQPRPYNKISVAGEKDVSGGMVAAFDPTKTLQPGFLEKMKTQYVEGNKVTMRVPVGMLIALIVIAGLIMGFAIYALFVSAFAFVGRLIELWLLIIASPLAFMSFSEHHLSHLLHNWGWDGWLKRLLATAFMAPAFMFFLYFIFMLVHAAPWKDMIKGPAAGVQDPAGFVKDLLNIILPTLLILILLLKSVKLAKTGAGEFGESIVNFGEKIAGTAGGLAKGAALGGAGLAGGLALGATGAVGRGTIGRVSNAMANSATLKWLEQKGLGGGLARKGLASLGKASFDARATPLGKVTGLNLGKAQAGGFVKDREEKITAMRKGMEGLKVGKNEKEMRKLQDLEADLQAKMSTPEAIKNLEVLDAEIAHAKEINNPILIKEAMDKKRDYLDKDLKVLALKGDIFDQKAKVAEINRTRALEYAKTLKRSYLGLKHLVPGSDAEANRLAAHDIMMEVKLESGAGGGHGGGGHDDVMDITSAKAAQASRAAKAAAKGGGGGKGGGGAAPAH